MLYLSMVWDATRNDIRSPAFISPPDIRCPPANKVPKTIPLERKIGTRSHLHHKINHMYLLMYQNLYRINIFQVF